MVGRPNNIVEHIETQRNLLAWLWTVAVEVVGVVVEFNAALTRICTGTRTHRLVT